MTTYIAVTIGPIYKTLGEAKRTRAVWAASYFFSWFMRRVLEKCTGKDDDKDQEMNVMLPYSEEVYKGRYGSGLYADRMYFLKDGKTTVEAIKTVTDAVFAEVETESNGELSAAFLKQYVNLHIVEATIDKAQLKGSYPLAELNKILDNAELKQNYPFAIETNPVQAYIVNKAGSETFLANDAFGEANKNRKFRSVSEIATTTLERTDAYRYRNALHQDFKNEDLELIDELKKNGVEVLPRHKYYAVLYADGDGISKLLAEIDKNEKLDVKAFSKTLFEFGLKAESEIASYGGNGIYLGGEDVLAFLPVACVTENNHAVSQSLFALIQKLDKCFEETVAKFALGNCLPVPTLSYGITISYVKHPVKECMKKAHDLLEKIKKKTPKNAIGIWFQKHSGQYTQCIIEKAKTVSTAEIYSLMEKYATTLNPDATTVLSSVIQRFKDDLFFNLFYRAAEEKRIDAFFDNFFNEDVHQAGNPKSGFLNAVEAFAEKVAADYPSEESCKNIVFTILRFIHFLNSKRD